MILIKEIYLLLSISCNDNNIKIWNVNNFECLVDIKKVNESGFLDSACILKDNKENYIVTGRKSDNNMVKTVSIKI